MVDGEDWLMRPILRGLDLYHTLVDGTLDLNDVARMNNALDIESVNQSKLADWQESQRG